MKRIHLLCLLIAQGLPSIASPLCSHVSLDIEVSADIFFFTASSDPENASNVCS